MPTISVLTVAKDAIRLDFHLEAMLRHHASFADEIVVMEGFSRDGTYERIKDIDGPIRIIREPWEATASFKDYVQRGLQHITGDWCVKLDADEFLPEWEWDRLRQFVGETNDILIPIRLRNFYGNYRVFHNNPHKVRWPDQKWCIHPNRDDIEYWGDGSNGCLSGQHADYGRSLEAFEVHHFGTVRHASRLREKWRSQAIRDQQHSAKYEGGRRIRNLPPWVFSIFPHDWLDEEFFSELEIYNGPIMQVVSDNPQEFTRDKMKLYRLLDSRIHLEQQRT